MAKKSTWDLEDWILLFGGIWLIGQVFKTAQKAGIGTLPQALRKLHPYINRDGIRVFDNELKKLSVKEQGEVIRLIIEARLKPTLQLPLFRIIRKRKNIDGEFRRGQWRILVKSLPNGDYIMLNFFKKQTNDRPEEEYIKAEKRGFDAMEP